MARRIGTWRRWSVFTLAFLLGLGASAAAWAREPVFSTTLTMFCFPPTTMTLPPCNVPTGLDPALVAPAPAGELEIEVFADDTANLAVSLSGLSPAQTLTAWFVHFPPNQPPPHPIFAPAGPGLPPIAFADSPVAHTRAAYTQGLGREPNQIRVRRDGSGRLVARLDFNPLKSGQVPLVNALAPAQQSLAPAGSGAEQSPCCPDATAAPLFEPVGGSLLRAHDPVTGFQLLGEDGFPELLRSPGRPVGVVIFVHVDRVTSGAHPGFPIPPFIPGIPATAGSVYLLGVFNLVPLGMD